MQEFKEILLGNASPALFAAAMLFALLTAGAMALFRVKKRDVSSERTPEKFSWTFFWSDNFKQILGTFILIFLTIRVAQYWLKAEWAVYGAVIIGLISDQLALLFLKIKDRATQFLSKKIDKVGDKVDTVEVKVDAIKEEIKEIKKDL